MFCKNCGREISNNAVVCPHCGVQTRKLATQGNPEGNAIAIVGFVFAFLISLVGLICSIIGYKNAKQGAPYKGLSVAGIVISVIGIASYLILIIAIVAAAGAAVAAV